MESGKLLLETADFDLNRELEGLVDMFSVQCVDHDIEIVLDLSGRSTFSLNVAVKLRLVKLIVYQKEFGKIPANRVF